MAKTNGVIFKAGPARDGGIWVRAEQCATCIFRPGNLMHLKPGVVAEMKRVADERGTCIVCHEGMDGPAAAVCAGYFEHHDSQLLRISEDQFSLNIVLIAGEIEIRDARPEAGR